MPSRELDKGCRTASIGCIDCKRVLLKNMMAELTPIREKALSLKGTPILCSTRSAGASRCKRMAAETMGEVAKSRPPQARHHSPAARSPAARTPATQAGKRRLPPLTFSEGRTNLLPMKDLSLGMFDSGIGGLTVLKEVRSSCPTSTSSISAIRRGSLTATGRRDRYPLLPGERAFLLRRASRCSSSPATHRAQ